MLKFDPHIHSSYSYDCKTKIEDILKVARAKKIDIICISDHDTVEGSKYAIKESKKYEDILVVPSIEISSSKGHILGIGIEDTIEKGMSPELTIEKIHENDGLAIIPHPYSFYRKGVFSKMSPDSLKIDGMEILNAKYFFGYSNYKSKKYSIKQNIPQLGASDSHNLTSIGSCFTEIDCDLNVDNVIKSIKSNKVSAKGKGKSYFYKSFKN